jgi:phage head maturation protease
MGIEYKKLPYFVKELDAKTRTVTGIFAVHGNIDDGRDMSEPGSFAKRLNDGSRNRVQFLWMHNSYNPPIASIKDIREVGRDGLGDKVLAWAPDATGGVLVTRKYYEGIELSDWVFKAIEEGDVREMSYAYQVHGYEIRTDELSGRDIRILKDVELYDISDVNWGMNPATAGVKGLPVPGMTFLEHSSMVAATVEELVMRVKDRKTLRELEGRSLSDAVRVRLQKMTEEITVILSETQPKADSKAAMNEYIKFLQTQASMIRS